MRERRNPSRPSVPRSCRRARIRGDGVRAALGCTKEAITRFTAPAYWKFESSFLQRRVSGELRFGTVSIQRVDLGSTDAVIEAAPIAYQADANRERLLIRDADVLAMARAAHKVFPEIPMIGCDIIREARTGDLYVLELNPGGNTWHFSSDSAGERRARMGPEQVEKMRQQFQALRTVAIALVGRTIAEAE